MLRGVSPDITEKNLDEMLAKLKARKIAVLLAGMRAAPNLGADYQTAFDAIYPKLAEKYDVPLYPFFLDGVAGRPACSWRTACIPMPKGVDRWSSASCPRSRRRLQRSRAEPEAGSSLLAQPSVRETLGKACDQQTTCPVWISMIR